MKNRPKFVYPKWLPNLVVIGNIFIPFECRVHFRVCLACKSACLRNFGCLFGCHCILRILSYFVFAFIRAVYLQYSFLLLLVYNVNTIKNICRNYLRSSDSYSCEFKSLVKFFRNKYFVDLRTVFHQLLKYTDTVKITLL